MPAGFTWVLRDVDVYANVGATSSVHLFIAELSTGATIVWEEYQPTERSMKQWTGRSVIPSLDGAGGLRISNDGANGVDVSCSGYVLSGP